MNVRPMIIDTIEDLVGSFLYYDRKGDEQLPLGVIEAAIQSKKISVQEITDEFHNQLRIVLQRTA